MSPNGPWHGAKPLPKRLTARLVFLTVGPMIDLKLFAMQAGIFGRRFARRPAGPRLVLGQPQWHRPYRQQ
jgi:hypothetical protein